MRSQPQPALANPSRTLSWAPLLPGHWQSFPSDSEDDVTVKVTLKPGRPPTPASSAATPPPGEERTTLSLPAGPWAPRGLREFGPRRRHRRRVSRQVLSLASLGSLTLRDIHAVIYEASLTFSAATGHCRPGLGRGAPTRTLQRRRRPPRSVSWPLPRLAPHISGYDAPRCA